MVAPFGIVIAGLVRFVEQPSPYGWVVHSCVPLEESEPLPSLLHVQAVAAVVVHALSVSKSSVKAVCWVADSVGSGIAHAPRERVKTASVVAPRSIEKPRSSCSAGRSGSAARPASSR